MNRSYVLEMQETGRAVVKSLLGDVTSSDWLAKREARFQFTTRSPDEEPFGDQRVRCQPSGKWEREILDLAR